MLYSILKFLYFLLVGIHALIHLMGFIKAFGLKEIKELTTPISKASGFIWGLACLLFLVYLIFQINHINYAWLIAFIAVILSQIVVIKAWPDARFATIINLIILLVASMAYANYTFDRNTHKLGNQMAENSQSIQMKADAILNKLDQLPLPVQQWLANSGALDQEKMHSVYLKQDCQIRLKPDQEEWYPGVAYQIATINNPAFMWSVDVQMNPLLWFKGRDTFQDGKAGMVIKLNSLFNIVNAKGNTLDQAALQRYLAEMVWYPQFALSSLVKWEAIDSSSARAHLNIGNTTGSGIFHFNEDGDFVKFSTMRFMDSSEEAQLFEWIITVDDYAEFQGVKVPRTSKASWRMEEGDWTWLKLEVTDLQYNIEHFKMKH